MSCKTVLRAALAAALAASHSAVVVQPDVTRTAAGECSSVVPSGEETYFPEQQQVQVDTTLAQLFTVKYAPTFKVLTDSMAKEQYVLTQCGQVQPTDAAVDAVAAQAAGYGRKHFSVPVRNAAALSTTVLAFVDALGVQDRVNFVDQYANAPCWQKALGCDAKFEPSYGNATLHAEQLSSVDVVFMDCGTDCANVNGQANGVHVSSTQEAGPVETAEYIKFIAAFFNMDPKANELFAAAKTSYAQASSGAAATPLVVAWISYNAESAWSAESFVVSQAAYKLTMVTDVGAVNFDAATKLAGIAGLEEKDAVFGKPASGKTYTVPPSSRAALLEALKDVDVVVDEFYAPDPTAYGFAEFLSPYGLTSSSDLKFVQNQMVLRIDRTMGDRMKGLDWYESRIAKPEWALEGLAHVLYGDTSKRAKYFRNIAKGDTVDQVLKADACLKALPVCTSATDPEPIRTLGEVELPRPSVSGAVPRRAALAAAAAAGASLWAAVIA